jgi:hypothetical protein
MKVEIDVEPAQWWVIVTEAERRHVTIAGLLMETATRVEAGRQALRTSITVLHSAGWDDGQISVRLGITRTAVATARRQAGLQPNKPRRTA